MVDRGRAGSHAALMDKVYRRQRYIYDLTRKYYLFGRDRAIRDLALSPGESLVEVGCGTARNLIKIARRYPGSELFGLDASAEMLRTAAHNVARAGLSQRIHLIQGYAENLTPSLFGLARPFDRVLFSYSLSMIPDWRQALRAAGAALAGAGQLHVVDFGDLTGLGPFAGKLLRGWLRFFHVAPRDEILRALEHDLKHDSDKDRRDASKISILPARYAFVWTCRKGALKDFGSLDVAAESQREGNSRG